MLWPSTNHGTLWLHNDDDDTNISMDSALNIPLYNTILHLLKGIADPNYKNIKLAVFLD